MCFFAISEKNTNRFKNVKNITRNQYLIYLCVLKRKRFLKHNFLIIRVRFKLNDLKNLFQRWNKK